MIAESLLVIYFARRSLLPKIVCMTQVYNENTLRGWDSKTNIRRFMEEVSKYCDALVIFDDGSTDGTRDVICELSGEIEMQIPSNTFNTPEYENYHRIRSLQHCARLDADWILCLDPDEIFESRVSLEKIKALCESVDETVDSIAFLNRHLWRTDRYVRVDGYWGHPTGPRLFRYSDKLDYDITPGLRRALAPEGLNHTVQCAYKIIHYGYSTDEAILSKFNRYKGFNWNLLSHLSDKHLRLSELGPLLDGGPKGPRIEAYDKHIHEILA